MYPTEDKDTTAPSAKGDGTPLRDQNRITDGWTVSPDFLVEVRSKVTIRLSPPKGIYISPFHNIPHREESNGLHEMILSQFYARGTAYAAGIDPSNRSDQAVPPA